MILHPLIEFIEEVGSMATSFDALEALLQFHEGISTVKPKRSKIHLAIPVPNPLDPAQPHLIIEGDAPNLAVHQQSNEKEAKYDIISMPIADSVVTTVPNPLMLPSADTDRTQHVRAMEPVSTAVTSSPTASSCDNSYTCFNNSSTPAHPSAPLSPAIRYAASMLALGEHHGHDRSDRLLDALNSMPQRGKKRQNLDEYERQELTRIRNREHAKCTRMRKKARTEELIEIEKKYMELEELESLQLLRRQRLTDFVEKSDVEGCPHYAMLYQLACQEFQEPEFAMIDSVALTTDNSGMVKVSVHGVGVECPSPRTLSGVISVDFAPGSTDIVAVSLYWSTSKSIPPPVSIFPSVSVLSFVS